jgi:hypothetical protein
MSSRDCGTGRAEPTVAAPSRLRPRIGYVPYSADLSHPGDSRRFPAYAKARGLAFEIARPDQAYDLVVLTETADIAVWRDYQAGKVVFDLIDSYLAIPLSDPKQLMRGLAWFAKGRHSRPLLNFRRALEQMCRRADAVVCTTEEQKSDIGKFCPNVHIALDMHHEVIGSTKSDYRAGTPIQLVWEGLPSNLFQLNTIGPALRQISREHDIRLNVVTDAHISRALPFLGRVRSLDVARRAFENVALTPWNAATWSDSITRCDIAVIPIDLDDPLTVGKPGNKLSLLWGAAMPVVTSTTPAYLAMQKAAGLERFACRNSADWLSALTVLINSEAARRDAAARGHAYVSTHLNIPTLLSQWDRVLESVGIETDFTPAR